MRISLTEAQRRALCALLSESEDAFQLADNEYTLDLFDQEPPLSLQLELLSDGMEVLAACELAYDEALAGWYIASQLEDEAVIRQRLAREPFFAP